MAKKTPIATNTDAFQEAQQAVFSNAGGPGGVQDNVPIAAGPSIEEEAVAKVQRQDASTFTDKVGSMWRQDGIVDGIVAHVAGSQMVPDPKWNPFEPSKWKSLSEGIGDELLPALYETRSEGHAMYVRDLLLQKQKDQQALGDLGAWGTAGRFAFGAVMPDQILAGMVGGRAAQAVKWAQVARAGRQVRAAATAGEAVAADAARAAEAAKVLAKDARLSSVASGAAAGGLANAGFEAVRQKYNFEDDSTSVLAAALMGAGMSVPFSLMHLKSARRLADTAAKEAEALEALRAVHSGEQVTPRQLKLVDEAVTTNKLVQDIEAGRMSVDEATTAVGSMYKRHELEAQEFLKDYDLKLRKDTEDFLEQRFPGYRQRREDAETAQGSLETYSKDARYDNAAADAELAFADGDLMAATVANARMERRMAKLKKAVDTPKEVDLSDPQSWFDLSDRHTPNGEPGTTAGLSEAPVAPPKPDTPADMVHWYSPENGQVIAGKATGDLMGDRLMVEGVDGHPYSVRRSELDHDSPLFKADEPAKGFLGGSIGAAQVLPIKQLYEYRSAFNGSNEPGVKDIPLRMDIFATLNRSENPLTQKLAFMLVKDALQVDKFDAQGWTASEWKSHFRRTIAGEFYSVARDAAREAVKARGLNIYSRITSGFDREFHELVTRVTRGDDSVLAANADIAPMLKKASAAMRKAYDHMYAEAFAAGVKGTDTISPKEFYVNRQWDNRKMRLAAEKHGWDSVHKLVAGAIKVPGHTGDLAKAAKFVGAIRKLEFSPVMQDILLHARDMGTLRSELRAAGKHLSDDDIDSIVDAMFEAKAKTGAADGGQAANLKFRFDLDENHVLSTGSGELRISDLLENDSRMLMDNYFNSLAGHTAMAKHGITSKADWDAQMREVSDWYTTNAKQADKAQSHLSLLGDIYANITGRPMSTQDFSTTNRVAGSFRAYTRSVMLGQLGFAAAFEMKQAAALFGLRAMTAQMPSLKGFFTSLRQGHVPDLKLARDISHIAGFGNEMAMSYARHAEVEDGFAGRTLNTFENATNSASHAVDVLSGNAGLTAMTRSWAGRMFTQHAFDLASGSKKLTPKWRERMVGWGIHDSDLDDVLAKLKEHTEKGPAGRVESINYEEWLKDSPETYESFQLGLTRAARDAVQDHDLGETMPFMHSTLGKVFGELKSFFLVAHAKNMLKNAHYRDATSFQVWSVGLMGEALAYATQTAANYAQDPEQLQKRLTMERIAQAAFFRMAAAGMLPTLLDTGYGALTGGDSLVQQGTTVGTDNRSMLQAPSLIMAGRLTQLPSTLGGLLMGTDVTTQNELRSAFGVLPGSRLLGISNGLNYLVEAMPKSDPSKKGR